MRTIDHIKKKLVEKGMDAALERNKGSRVYEEKIDGEIEAKRISMFEQKYSNNGQNEGGSVGLVRAQK